MNLLALPGPLLLYRPLLLERSYGGSGEAWYILGLFGLGVLASSAVLLVLVKLSNWANEEYGEAFHRFLKRAGIVVALFYVVFLIASIGSHR